MVYLSLFVSLRVRTLHLETHDELNVVSSEF